VFERFSRATRYAIDAAQREAGELAAPAVGTEHLLLGITLCPEPTLPQVLLDHGVSLDRVRATLREHRRGHPTGSDDDAAPGDPPLPRVRYSRQAKEALELALREALARDDTRIEAGHLMLGILRVADPATTTLLGGEEGIDRLGAAVQELLDRGAQR
jgi:ATP-dependent Clp protease ATP-binding subunit ClpA